MLCFRLDDLRHRLIPRYSYDPTEQEEEDTWGEAGVEQELTVRDQLLQSIDYIQYLSRWWRCKFSVFSFCMQEPLYKDGKLSFPSDYGS